MKVVTLLLTKISVLDFNQSFFNLDGVTIKIDISQVSQLVTFASKVQKILVQWYPMISQELSSPNYTPPDNFRIIFDQNYNGAAGAIPPYNLVIASVNFYKKYPNDIGSLVHEMTHIIQQINNGPCPDWLVEGIADWIRYYKYEPSKMMPSKPISSQNFTSGYETAAYFLQYIIDITPQWRAPQHIVYWANKDCREGTYNDSMWQRMTGKTLNQLWQDMMKSTAVVPANATQYGCYKAYCWSWCKQRELGNWCYTTRGQKNDLGWVQCTSWGDCNINWQCANDCHPKDYTK